MRSIEALKLLPIWVDPAHLVSTAKIILAGHQARALGVLEFGKLVGTVSMERLATEPEFKEIRDIVEQPRLVLEGSMSVRQAAERFVQEGVDYAPVMDEDRYLGIVTAVMLLRELGRSWDPLTSLSWSDVLREWGIEQLRRGSEITILFFDLNDFGRFNKRFGHIVGDNVLRQVSSLLSESIDPERDVLVRYGGDEFAIGTIIPPDDAEALAAMIQRRMAEVFVPEATEPISTAVGMSGGKRTKERDNVHYAATLDNLINLASKACMVNKQAMMQQEAADPERAAVVEANHKAPSTPPMVQVVGVLADETAGSSVTSVILSIGEQVVSGVHSKIGTSVLESVAAATAKALELGFPGAGIRIEELHLAEGIGGQRLVSVSGEVSDGEKTIPMGGVSKVEKDLYGSVADATITAFLTARGMRQPAPH
jgi:IMP dehydrogenase